MGLWPRFRSSWPSLLPEPALQKSSPSPLAFQAHLSEAFQRLRAALTEALVSIGADPGRARELGRLLGVNKNLAWRVSKIVTAVDAVDAVPHVPGASAFATLQAALAKAGVPAAKRQAVQDAVKAYDTMMVVHSGDRAALDQLTAGMTRAPGAAERLVQSRRQAFMGLGSTWGVQAQTQFLTILLAPSSDDPTMSDLVDITGLVGLRRLRDDARWTLFRRQRTMDDGSDLAPFHSEPLQPGARSDGLPFLDAFSSPNVPALDTVQVGKQTRWVLPAGPVGRTAAVDCLFGEIHRAALPRFQSENNVVERLGLALVTPVERIQVDLVVSDELPFAHDLEAVLYSQLDGGGQSLADENANPRLPLLEEVHELGRGLGTMASPHVPRYTELLQLAFERTGWDDQTFRGYRLTMRYPPIPTVMALAFELPVAS